MFLSWYGIFLKNEILIEIQNTPTIKMSLRPKNPMSVTDFQQKVQPIIAQLANQVAIPFYRKNTYRGGSDGNFFWRINIYDDASPLMTGPLKIPSDAKDLGDFSEDFARAIMQTMEQKVHPLTKMVPIMFIVVVYRQALQEGYYVHNQSLIIPLQASS